MKRDLQSRLIISALLAARRRMLHTRHGVLDGLRRSFSRPGVFDRGDSRGGGFARRRHWRRLRRCLLGLPRFQNRALDQDRHTAVARVERVFRPAQLSVPRGGCDRTLRRRKSGALTANAPPGCCRTFRISIRERATCRECLLLAAPFGHGGPRRGEPEMISASHGLWA